MLNKLRVTMLTLAVLCLTAIPAFADDYDGIFDRGNADTPFGVFFYVLGDIVSLPFDLIGSLL